MADNGQGWNDPKGQKDDQGKGPLGRLPMRSSLIYAAVILVAITVFNYFLSNQADNLIDFSAFKAKIESGEIKRVELSSAYFTGYDGTAEDAKTRKVATYKTAAITTEGFIKYLDEKKVQYTAIPEGNNAIFAMILNWVLPFLLLFIVWRFLMKRMMGPGGMGGNVLSFGQNKSRVVAEGDTRTKFSDVAGVEEAKDELVEVVDFLKNPRKYTEIGGKIPKGVLLVGPPGTGKTLLARAVAGEAGVPFFRLSGSDFVEMFVGVGASRVRDLFQKAREKAPCIVFIDELDAIGKSRLSGLGGNDEREQTLNQLLVEMDGFDATSGLILLAATNRPDVLDPALLRPGRFDRQVLVDRPDLSGREAILRIHARSVKLDQDVDLAQVARGTPGFAGADLANVVNEAALLAVRNGRRLVRMEDFSEAIEKAMAGLKKKSRVINPKEKKVIAVHETGHALVAGFAEGADPVQKISIIPRGFGALGYTLQVPTEDRYLMTEAELRSRIDVLLGGRAAEEILLGEISTGAANDLARATDIARRMITDYGMSGEFRNVALTQRGQQLPALGPSTGVEPFMQKEYSDATQRYVDEEIARIMEDRYAKTRDLLAERKDLLIKVSSVLLEKETIDEAEFRTLIAS